MAEHDPGPLHPDTPANPYLELTLEGLVTPHPVEEAELVYLGYLALAMDEPYSKIRTWKARDLLPAHRCMDGHRPMWLKSDLDRWAAKRVAAARIRERAEARTRGVI